MIKMSRYTHSPDPKPYWRSWRSPSSPSPARLARPTPAPPRRRRRCRIPTPGCCCSAWPTAWRRRPAWRVTMRSSYDAIQPDGQRIESGERRQILLQRPDRCALQVERSDGERGAWCSTVAGSPRSMQGSPSSACVQRPGSLDQGACVYMVRDLQATMLLARLFTTRAFPVRTSTSAPCPSRSSRSAHGFYVLTHHLAARSEDVDRDLWIAKGPEPLPRRVVITCQECPGTAAVPRRPP